MWSFKRGLIDTNDAEFYKFFTLFRIVELSNNFVYRPKGVCLYTANFYTFHPRFYKRYGIVMHIMYVVIGWFMVFNATFNNITVISWQ